ncbi:MAG: alanine racemase [Nitrospinae bacterium]|nr:alanine racemase [Nitrospinota bacterium]
MLKASIDLGAFRRNHQSIKQIVGKNVAVLPVIKADAYGHGMIRMAKEALKLGAPVLGAGTLDEGILIRQEKIASPVLLLDGIFPDQAEDAVKYRLTPVVFSVDSARELDKIGKKKARKIPIHIKFDTGMGRIGWTMSDSAKALEQLVKLKNLQVEGIMTHLASSADLGSPQTDHQLMRFNAVLAEARRAGLAPTYVHAANSGGVINHKPSHFTMVRPGISLYGYPPSETKGVEFEEVMTVTSKLLSVKDVQQGEGVGYGATYITPRIKKIGVVMGGYADGVNRLLSNKGSVVINERAVPILGMVCMDNFMVDLSKCSGAKPGDEVVLLGGGHEETSAEKLAELTGTISYEVLCRMGSGPRITRNYVNG